MSCSMWADERRVLSVVARELRVMGPAMVSALLDGPANFFEANAGNLSIETCFFCENLGKIRPIAHTRLHFRKLLKFPLKAKGGIGRGTRGMFLLVPSRRSSNNSANCLVGFFSRGIREFP